MVDNLRKFTTQEVLNKVYTDSSGDTIGLQAQTSKETLNAVLNNCSGSEPWMEKLTTSSIESISGTIWSRIVILLIQAAEIPEPISVTSNSTSCTPLPSKEQSTV